MVSFCVLYLLFTLIHRYLKLIKQYSYTELLKVFCSVIKVGTQLELPWVVVSVLSRCSVLLIWLNFQHLGPRYPINTTSGSGLYRPTGGQPNRLTLMWHSQTMCCVISVVIYISTRLHLIMMLGQPWTREVSSLRDFLCLNNNYEGQSYRDMEIMLPLYLHMGFYPQNTATFGSCRLADQLFLYRAMAFGFCP